MEKMEGPALNVEQKQYAELVEFGYQIEKAEQDLAAMESQLQEFRSRAEAAHSVHDSQTEAENQMLDQYNSTNDPGGLLRRNLADMLAQRADSTREQMRNDEEMVRIAEMMKEDFRAAYEKLKNMRRLYLEQLKK